MAEAHPPENPVDAADRMGEQLWREALLAVRVLAVAGPSLGGVRVQARAGPVRDAFLQCLETAGPATARIVRASAMAPLSRLTGGVDVSQSVAAARLVSETGLLALADGGALLLSMAERLEPANAAVIGAAMDNGTCPDPANPGQGVETRFVVIALDEAADDGEALPAALADRLGLTICLDRIGWHHVAQAPAPAPLPSLEQCRATHVSGRLHGFLSAVALTCAGGSLRRHAHLVLVARILAAMSDRNEASEADAVMAARLCFGVLPAAPDEDPAQQQQAQDDEPAPDPPPGRNDTNSDSKGDRQDAEFRHADEPPGDRHTESETARLMGLLDLASAEVLRGGRRPAGKAGAMARNARRGRQYGTSHGPPYPGARPDIVATLNAAAPWQIIRLRERAAAGLPGPASGRLQVRKSDFRFKRRRHAAPSTAIFVVDASGSTAHERLGEAKGAVEGLLARCYVRRDEVALVAFRGTGAQTALAPTRSLLAAKRKLAALAGGGPTPLVAGLRHGLELALSVRRAGNSPVVVLLTDGSGNMALDGTPDRARAARELEQIAGRFREQTFRKLCIDVSRRPRGVVNDLSRAMGADYHFMRQAEAGRMSELVDSHMQEGRP